MESLFDICNRLNARAAALLVEREHAATNYDHVIDACEDAAEEAGAVEVFARDVDEKGQTETCHIWRLPDGRLINLTVDPSETDCDLLCDGGLGWDDNTQWYYDYVRDSHENERRDFERLVGEYGLSGFVAVEYNVERRLWEMYTSRDAAFVKSLEEAEEVLDDWKEGAH